MKQGHDMSVTAQVTYEKNTSVTAVLPKSDRSIISVELYTYVGALSLRRCYIFFFAIVLYCFSFFFF